MTQNNLCSTLHIHNLELNINLGWRSKERRQEQAVLLDMDIQFPSPPAACLTDKLDDTVCYAKLIDVIREKLALKHFRLIEHLSSDIFIIAKQYLPDNYKIHIRLTKYPRIGGLRGGVSFEYGDKI